MIIGPVELLPALKRTVDEDSEVLAFSDAEALRALEVVSRRRPGVVIVEQTFAATPRGAALISRVKADPTLTHSVIRLVGGAPEQVPAAPPTAASGGPAVATSTPGAPGSAPATPRATPRTSPVMPLDQRGTRRRPRVKIAGLVELIADGNVAAVVDLSPIGAQVVSAVILKPNQKLRVILADDQATLRFSARVAWASFEIPPKSGPRYRAGLAFLDADAEAVAAFCVRHKVSEP